MNENSSPIPYAHLRLERKQSREMGIPRARANPASPQGFVCCAEPSSAWVLWSRLSLPLFVSPGFCLLPLVSWLVTKGPREPPLLWGGSPLYCASSGLLIRAGNK